MTNEGFKVDPQALQQVTKGINQAMAELKELGFDIEANLGRGFGDLKLTDLELGDAGLRQALDTFCDRWGWGVRALMQDANGFALRLNLSAGLYHEQEQYLSNTAKELWSDMLGNPGLTDEEVRKRSWGETVKDNPGSHVMDADYSPHSFQQAGEESRQAWQQTWQEVKTSPLAPDGMTGEKTDWQWSGGPKPEDSQDGDQGGER